jgi:ABC-2 type transport system permease protein
MNKTLVVAKWEYLEKVKSKAFLIGLLLTPIIMVGMGVLPTLLAGKEDEATKVIGVIDATGELHAKLSQRMEKYLLSEKQPNYLLHPIAVGKGTDLAAASKEADTMVERGSIEGYIVFGPNAFADTSVEYRSKSAGDFRLVGRLRENVKEIVSERKFTEHGIDPQLTSLLRTPLEIKTVKLSREGEMEETTFMRTFFSAYAFIMALFFLILTSGQLLVRSVLEEKSNRIIEVLVSSCTPSELMAGKVLGLSALGLTQMGFWSLIGLVFVLVLGAGALPPAGQVLLLLLYFLLGYLLYSAVFIALGTPVTTEQEAQQVNGYLVMFLILPIALVIPVMQHPNAGWVKVLTYIPLLTPTFMALRIGVQMPDGMEIAVTVLLLVVSIYLMMIAAGRIFRVAILATGKRPGVRELIRWARAG